MIAFNLPKKFKSGEENSEPLQSSSNNWDNVDYFLHTWGFLPNDHETIQKISSDDKEYLILLMLDMVWRKLTSDEQKLGIKKIKKTLEKYGHIQYFKKKNANN